MGMVDQSLVFWDLAVEVAKRSGVDEACIKLTVLFNLGVGLHVSRHSYCCLLQARLRKLRSAQLMRSLAAKTPFTLAAVELVGAHRWMLQMLPIIMSRCCNVIAGGHYL